MEKRIGRGNSFHKLKEVDYELEDDFDEELPEEQENS